MPAMRPVSSHGVAVLASGWVRKRASLASGPVGSLSLGTLPAGLATDRGHDMMERAHALHEQTMRAADYEIDGAGRRAIEEIVRRAERALAT